MKISSFLINYKAKIVVFIFAIFIWFLVVTENEYEYDIDLPVTPVHIPAGKVILNDVPSKAMVKIRGNGKDLIALMVSRGARVELDLSNFTQSKTFILEPKHVILSRPIGSIEAKEIITPDSVYVILDDFAKKKVPVFHQITLKTLAGYTPVGDLKIKPDSVFISGPQSIISGIDKVETEAKILKDRQFDINNFFSLKPIDNEKVVIAKTQVKVYQNIQKLLEFPLKSVPIQIRNSPRNVNVRAEPSTLSLVLEGGGDLLNEVSRDDIVAYIDYSRVKNYPGNEFPAVISTPKGISYRDVKPKKFRLVFEKPDGKK
ncbi:MAG: YbbR-like domain-containing protein [bacterium]